jgi:hypothetical protein
MEIPATVAVRFRSMALLVLAAAGSGHAMPLDERLAAAHLGFLDERRANLMQLSDPFQIAPAARVVVEPPDHAFQGRHPWKRNIAATIFWVGEAPTENNPTPNNKSAWDTNWEANFGGYDDPDRRNGLLPAAFVPRLNPFYIALPYNDVAPGGVHRPEAAEVIPWFWERYQGDGISVCKGRWLAIHHQGRVCFAQWEDVGPFEVDHFGYVFGNEAPRPNRNKNAGIDVSPAVRDFLNLKSGAPVEWRFVEDHEVPAGPWKLDL